MAPFPASSVDAMASEAQPGDPTSLGESEIEKIALDNLPLVRQLVFGVIEGMVANGQIDPHGKSDDELFREGMACIGRFRRDGGPPLQFITDFTDDLLGRAREQARCGRYQDSCLFYTLWFEHHINRLLLAIGRQKRFDHDAIEQLVRRTAIRDKTTWVMRLLGCEEIPSHHTRRILAVEEMRNSYVHYKWKPESEELSSKMKQAVTAIEATVRYLRQHEDRHLFGGQRSRVKRLFGGYRMSQKAAKDIAALVRKMKNSGWETATSAGGDR